MLVDPTTKIRAKMPIPSEYEEQVALVKWMEIIGLKFTAIPNSTWTTSNKQKAKNTASGLRPGFPDLTVIIPERKTLEGHVPPRLMFIEMKRQDASPSDVKPEQCIWLAKLARIPGVTAVVCKGWDDARKAIEWELRK